MALRGDPTSVLELTGTTDVDAALVWLTAASAVVDQRLVGAGLSGAILTRIEEHLAAHYLEIGAGRGITSERFPDWAVTYASGSLAELRTTRNGQIAVALDTSGFLSEASKPKPAFAVL